jgi:hypothetical protein
MSAAETSVESGADWYCSVAGEQRGPLSRGELELLARGGGLHPRTDMVWAPGMADWVAAGEVEGLFERRRSEPVAEAAPAADPWLDELDDDSTRHREIERAWPGTGRGGYFFGTVVLPVVGQFGLAFLTPVVANVAGSEVAMYVPFLAFGFVVIALAAVLQRLSNLGMSRWWFFGFLVPFLGWWLGYRCFACPPGYAIHRKLDPLGWVLAVLY